MPVVPREETAVMIARGSCSHIREIAGMGLWLSALAILLCCGELRAAGTTAGEFLNITAGARAAGMGEAFTAVGGDASVIFRNPAGLAGLHARELAVSHTLWFQDIQYSHAAFVLPVKPAVEGGHGGYTIGVALLHTGVDDIERRSGNTPHPEGQFGASDLAVTVSVGRDVALIAGAPLSAGLSATYIRQSIDTYVAETAAAAAGVLVPFRLGGVPCRAGVAMRNLGAPVRFISESYPLPLTFAAGIACQPPIKAGYPLLIACEAAQPADAGRALHIGAEYVAAQTVAFRLGYADRSDTSRAALTGSSFRDGVSDGFTGFTAGVGFTLAARRGPDVPADSVTIDYAFAPYGELGETHCVSVGFRW